MAIRPTSVTAVSGIAPDRSLLTEVGDFCRERPLGAIGDVIIAIAIPMIPRAALVARSSALAIREMPYVDAARAAGYRHQRIILRHMLPNVMAPYLIMLTAYLGQAILLEASLSFLGL